MTTDSDQPTSADGSCCEQQQQQQQQQHIKRPMNPFMVWAQTRRKVIAAENPKLHNSDISRRLGEEWRTLPDKEKQPFRDEASRLKSEHRAAHPDYKYQPKCKKRPASTQQQSDSSGEDCGDHQNLQQLAKHPKLQDSEINCKKLDQSTAEVQQVLTPTIHAYDQPPADQSEILLPPLQPQPQQQQQQYVCQVPSYSQVIYVDQNQLNYLLQQQQQQQQQYVVPNQLEQVTSAAQSEGQLQQQHLQHQSFYGPNYQLDPTSSFIYHQQQQPQLALPDSAFYSHSAPNDGALMLSQL
ncbi:hypothetical protein BOX15_Mlig032231g3 [Macrostomum lignano]|uniref:Sex-determining region Y protein n=1 Tax=Macrostomum lignano TaxID=282301 RepID=A0A267GHD9_9PLAT|nr:hypothetical protein BOX15_Mlig032231g3 [Macrostomum lignano]